MSPIDVYKLLPRTNCKECGEENCMAFATKLVNREVTLDKCIQVLEEKNIEAYNKIWKLLKPPVREITIGSGEKAVKIGGKLVMYRHEFTYVNPTAIAIDVTDEMEDNIFMERVKGVGGFSYNYIGRELSLDMVAIRSTSKDPQKFESTVKKFVDSSTLPAVLCSFYPEVIESGLAVIGKNRPLIYAATEDNWKAMADLALMHDCPLAVFAPNNLGLLRSLIRTLLEYGVQDLVLDPGTFPQEGFADTINAFTMIRRLACNENDELLGFPLLGVPLAVWLGYGGQPEIATWRETWLASALLVRYADALIMHSLDGWSQLPLTILRDNIYTDPRKPVAVEPGLRAFGNPNDSSPLLFTSNFALTYYTVASDIESSKIDCYVLVVDTEGISVESAVAGRKLTADKVAETLKEYKVEEKVKHKILIIPGRAARISGEIEEVTGFQVMVGPLDSSGIVKYINEKWLAKPNA
ncbi:acetyl-CoA decarbonylase/synthase complex subunit gamma [Candidatus Bathyarchaeota archaeon]|nr:acetyl-CoA decarbonylase/synthase complex subunit gamma [Candidatus Bathyarchaeota archaeon]